MVSPEAAESSAGRTLGDQAASAQHADTVGEVLDLVEVVRREQHGRTAGAQRADQVPRTAARRRVEPSGRLVEEQQIGIPDDAESEVEAAALAAGESVAALVDRLVESDQPDALLDRPRSSVAAPVQGEHLAHRQHSFDSRGLQNDADPIAERTIGVGRVAAEHGDRPRRSSTVALEDLDGRRLASPVLAEKAVHLSGLDDEGDGRPRRGLRRIASPALRRR